MASIGPNSPGTMADDATVGTVAWSNPDNAKVSDDVYATAYNNTGAGAYFHYLKATNFGFAIPGGATINGILVEVEKKGGAGVVDISVFIVKSDGTLGTTNKAIGTAWPASDTYASYGSSSDLWNETWDSTKINDVDFGIAISPYVANNWTGSVDHIRITVYYTEGSASNVLDVQYIGGVASGVVVTQV